MLEQRDLQAIAELIDSRISRIEETFGGKIDVLVETTEVLSGKIDVLEEATGTLSGRINSLEEQIVEVEKSC